MALKSARTRPMPSQNDFDRRNDLRFLTPLLLMASIVAIAILIYAIYRPFAHRRGVTPSANGRPNAN
jgi:hypothetical protein